MLKKTISAIIALILIFSAMPSCTEVPGEDTAPETETIPETTAVETDATLLHSFIATGGVEVAWPKEKDSWFGVYLPDRLVNGELRPNINEGETVEIVYAGEITAHERESYGVIKDLHSITLVNDPRTYGGIDYGVAVLRSLPFSYSDIKASEANLSNELPMILAKSSAELYEYAYTYFFSEPVFRGTYTEEQVEKAKRWSDRFILLSNYNDDFFAQNDLLMLFIKSGSGGARYDVIDIAPQDGVLTINVAMTRGYSTEDMGFWVYFISLPKTITALTSEYTNAYTNLALYSKSLQYGYIGTDLRTKALNYTGEDQPYYTPWIFTAESDDDLNAIFELIRNPSGVGAFDDDNAKKAYNLLFDQIGKGYFESNALIVIYRAAGSSGDTFKVSSITTAGDTLTVGISQTEHGVTGDMSGWLFVVPVHKNVLKNITTYAAE